MSAPVIVGIDGSPVSVTALRWTLGITLPTTRVVAVHCWERTSVEMLPGWVDETRSADLEAVRSWCSPDQDRPNLEILSVDADPRGELLHQADAHDAAMVIVGDRGHGGVLGLGLGSVASHLLHEATTPVAIVSAHELPPTSGPIVVGVDGSEANRPALEWAVAFAVAHGSPLIALHVAETEADLGSGAIYENWAWPSADAVRDEIVELGLDANQIDVRFAVGHPVEVLEKVSAREHSVATVVGTRGRGGFGGLRIGRIPEQLAHVASRPVIVIPHT